MASHAYLFIKGIEGSCNAEGHEKEIEITALKQNFSFAKENIKTGNIQKNVTSLLAPLENMVDNAKLEEMSKQLITEFRNYKQSVRKGLQDTLNNTELGTFSEELKSIQEYIQSEIKKLNNSTTTSKQLLKELTKERLELFLKNKLTGSSRLETQTRLDNIDGVLNKNNKQLAELETRSAALSKFFEGEKKIEKLISNIKNSVARRDPLNFTKYYDKSSPKLLEACCTGQIFDECRLMIYRSVYPTGSGKVTLSAELLNNFVHVKFYNAYVTSYSITHSNEDNPPQETIKMNYDKVEFKFAQGDPVTGKKGQQKIISWDWKTNKAEEKGG